MTPHSYSLNCDLGEGVAHEPLIIPWIDVASVACGGHFGDSDSIQETLTLAKRFGKKVGAHPSYPDLENFGRKTMEIEPELLIRSLREQIQLFLDVVKKVQMTVDHIKFHGALYNDAAEKSELALLVAVFLKNEFPNIPLFVPPHSEIQKAALEKGLPIRLEIFGDRAYQTNYKLLSRSEENSLFTDKKRVISHLESIIEFHQIQTWKGELIPIQANTICIHGDNPGIMEFLPSIRDRFWK